MKIGIVGAGAIGGRLGAGPIEAGEDVVLIARGPNLVALRERGLNLRKDGVTRAFRPALMTSDPGRAGHQDAIVVATKATAGGQVVTGGRNFGTAPRRRSDEGFWELVVRIEHLVAATDLTLRDGPSGLLRVRSKIGPHPEGEREPASRRMRVIGDSCVETRPLVTIGWAARGRLRDDRVGAGITEARHQIRAIPFDHRHLVRCERF